MVDLKAVSTVLTSVGQSVDEMVAMKEHSAVASRVVMMVIEKDLTMDDRTALK